MNQNRADVICWLLDRGFHVTQGPAWPPKDRWDRARLERWQRDLEAEVARRGCPDTLQVVWTAHDGWTVTDPTVAHTGGCLTVDGDLECVCPAGA